MILLELFFTFFQIGSFSFGGGYAALPLIQSLVVDQNHWITMQEYTNLITISQMTPGPIAINAASFIGMRMGGPLGAVVATFSCVLPAIILLSILAKLYQKDQDLSQLQDVLLCIRPAVVAFIGASACALVITAFWPNQIIHLNETNWLLVGVFVVCLYILYRFKWSPILVMVLAGILNLFYKFLMIQM